MAKATVASGPKLGAANVIDAAAYVDDTGQFSIGRISTPLPKSFTITTPVAEAIRLGQSHRLVSVAMGCCSGPCSGPTTWSGHGMQHLNHEEVDESVWEDLPSPLGWAPSGLVIRTRSGPRHQRLGEGG